MSSRLNLPKMSICINKSNNAKLSRTEICEVWSTTLRFLLFLIFALDRCSLDCHFFLKYRLFIFIINILHLLYQLYLFLKIDDLIMYHKCIINSHFTHFNASFLQADLYFGLKIAGTLSNHQYFEINLILLI